MVNPMLDVSDVLLDPMFAQTIVIMRRAQTITTGGLAVDTDTTLNTIGVVTISGNKYALEPDLEREQDNITVHVRVPLRGPANGYEPDVVVWQGNRYTVVKALDWSQYGAGFYAADCEMLDTQTAIV